MSEQALATTRLEPAAAVLEEVREEVRPNLSKDLAALLALLFIFIIYHIQHPTLLFRVTFGETFRDVREEGFQEAIVYGLIFSLFVLVGAWGQLWADRKTLSGRLCIAIIAGILIYILYAAILILRNSNIFTQLYDIPGEEFLESLRMSRSQAEVLGNPIKTLSATALWGGIGLASLVYLWSPWESIRHYWIFSQQKSRPTSQLQSWLFRDTLGIALVVLWFLTYRVANPLWLYTSDIGRRLGSGDERVLIGWGFLIVGEVLVGLQLRRSTAFDKRTRHLFTAVAVISTLYILHTVAILWQHSNYFAGYYDISVGNYDELLANPDALGTPVIIDGLKATDWASLLAGIAMIGVVYFWSPWERLDLYRGVVREHFTALVVAVHVLFLWETAVDLFNIEQFLLPKPTVIWEAFKEIYPGVIAGSWYTFQNALRGFAYGCGAGILTGLVAARYPRLSRAILPLAVAANAVPIIAFAPISNQWFGFTSPNSKAAIAAVLCYFPAMISTVQGLTSVQPIQLELMRSYAASEFEIFRKVRLPNALPYMFSAFKLAATLSMIGAIVAEFFGGSPATALGFSITDNARKLRITDAWTGIIVASLLGIGFYVLVSVLERTAMPWYGSFREDSR